MSVITLDSKIESKIYSLYELEQKLKPLGFDIGGNWDYDHGYLDYKINDEVGYQFLRLPFEAVDGQLDSKGTTVKMGKPFLLSHKYQRGLDDHAFTWNGSASFDQFSEPVDADASFPEEYIDVGKSMLQEVEAQLGA